MFYTNITVEIPEKKRISWNKNKPYVTEIFSRKGKNTIDDCQVVGIAVSKGSNLMYPNNIYYERHPECILENTNTEEIHEFCPCQSVGQNMLIDAVCEESGLNEILVQTFGPVTAEIESFLTYAISQRDMDINGFETYMYDHYSGVNYIPNIGKLFNEKITHEKINLFLEKWFQHNLKLSGDVQVEIDFDSTNINTASKEISYAEKGKAKVDEGLPQVNFAYLVDRQTGVPIHFDIFYGSIVDMEHCKNYISKIEAIKKDAKTMVCMDRGYYISTFLTNFYKKYHFCVMGKENDKFDEFINNYPKEQLMKSENRVIESTYGVHFKDIPFKNWDPNEKLHIYLYCDNLKNNYSISKELDKLDKVAEQITGKKDKSGNILRTWKNKLIIEIDSKTKIITSAKVNHEKFDEIHKKNGYFYIVSDMEMSPKEMLAFYRHRDIIEKCFRLSKSEEDLFKTYAQTDTNMESKLFVGFLCSIIRSHMLHQMEPFFFQYRNESTQSVINEMGKIKLDKISGKVIPLCSLTNKQKQIMSFYHLSKKDIISLVDEFTAIQFPN